MRYKLTPSFNDGKNDAPAIEVEVPTEYHGRVVDGIADQLLDYVHGELMNDYGEPIGVGFTLTIERVA